MYNYQQQQQLRAHQQQQNYPLPPGWEAKYEPSQQRWYFINHATQTTTWTDPRIDLQKQQQAQAAATARQQQQAAALQRQHQEAAVPQQQAAEHARQQQAAEQTRQQQAAEQAHRQQAAEQARQQQAAEQVRQQQVAEQARQQQAAEQARQQRAAEQARQQQAAEQTRQQQAVEQARQQQAAEQVRQQQDAARRQAEADARKKEEQELLQKRNLEEQQNSSDDSISKITGRSSTPDRSSTISDNQKTKILECLVSELAGVERQAILMCLEVANYNAELAKSIIQDKQRQRDNRTRKVCSSSSDSGQHAPNQGTQSVVSVVYTDSTTSTVQQILSKDKVRRATVCETSSYGMTSNTSVQKSVSAQSRHSSPTHSSTQQVASPVGSTEIQTNKVSAPVSIVNKQYTKPEVNAQSYHSKLRCVPKGPNPKLCKGPDPTLLLKARTVRVGPDPANYRGPQRSNYRGPNPRNCVGPARLAVGPGGLALGPAGLNKSCSQ